MSLNLGLGLGVSRGGGGADAPDLVFRSTWNTANTSAGSSTSTQVALPLVSGGTYNFVVDWGDGTTDAITVWNAAATTHTYASGGVKTITITGVCIGWRFNNTLDRLKLTSISNFGSLTLTNLSGAFYGCSNLVITATDMFTLSSVTNLSFLFGGCSSITTIPGFQLLNTASITNMSYMFFGCTSFNQSISSLNTAAVTSMEGMFTSCAAFNQSVANFNTASVTNMTNMFLNCAAFNQSVAGFNTSAVTIMYGMFQSCAVFNQSVANFNTASVTSMAYMFNGATSFNQSVASFTIPNMTSAFLMFQNSGFATANYDLLLSSWGPQTKQNNVPFHAGSAKYSSGTPATNRAILVAAGWTITDGGAV
jgi:surface protein